jgi:transcriptional regulator with XRE-family HTH domain
MSRSDWNSQPEIGQRLRLVRQARESSLTSVAEACGLSAATLSRIENGKQDLTIATLVRLCEVLGCSPNDMLSAEQREPHSLLAALRDVQRAKEAFRGAAAHLESMEKRLRVFARPGKRRA